MHVHLSCVVGLRRALFTHVVGRTNPMVAALLMLTILRPSRYCTLLRRDSLTEIRRGAHAKCAVCSNQPSWLGLSPREAVCTTRSSRKLMQSCQTQSRCVYLLRSGLLASPESVPGCLQGDAVARPSQGCQNARMHSIQSSSPRWPARLRLSITRCMTVRSKSLGARRAPVYE